MRKTKANKCTALTIAGKIAFVFLCILLSAALLLTCAATFLLIADGAVDATARTLPSYERQDLTQTLAKDSWDEEDYTFLYLQTGLGRPALDALKGDGERILAFQDALFYDGAIEHQKVALTTKRDVFESGYTAPLAPLEEGDVLVTSTCHTYGWRNGHAAIVTEAKTGTILQSVSLGLPSTVDRAGVNWFLSGTNFLVLRLKDADAEARAAIAATAEERLCGVPYSITVGIFSPKDQGETPQETHCSHLVWQAFKYYGYDIDADGGPVCTARDIANSPCFEVVQVFGFDPVSLW